MNISCCNFSYTSDWRRMGISVIYLKSLSHHVPTSNNIKVSQTVVHILSRTLKDTPLQIGLTGMEKVEQEALNTHFPGYDTIYRTVNWSVKMIRFYKVVPRIWSVLAIIIIWKNCQSVLTALTLSICTHHYANCTTKPTFLNGEQGTRKLCITCNFIVKHLAVRP